MSLTPEQRTEVLRIVSEELGDIDALAQKIIEIDKVLVRNDGRFERLDDRVEKLDQYNGRSHDEFRNWQREHAELSETWRPAVEWMLGIRIAWSRIVVALVIMGLGSAITGLLWLLTYFRSLPTGGPVP